MKKPWGNPEFWLAIFLALLIPAIWVLFYPHSPDALRLGDHDTYHWFAWTGAGYIALTTPLFFYLKRRYKTRYQLIMRIHMFGNILALLVLAFHFSFQVGSPPVLGNYTHLGLTMYTALLLSLVTGILLRYHLSGK